MDKKATILKSITLGFGIAELRDDGILTFEPNLKTPIYSLDQLKEMLVVFKEMTAGEPHLYFSNNDNLTGTFGSQEKVFMSTHFHEFATAFAMTEKSAMTRFITHTFIHLNKPKIPIKMFKTKAAAIEWLKSL